MPLSDDQPHTRTRLPVAEQTAPVTGRQARPLRTLLTVLAVVTLLVVAVSIANRSKPDPGRSTGATSGDRATAATPDRTAASGQQPATGTANGIATGYPHTEQGAQSAAANYAVALGSTEMFRTDGRRTVLATLADPTVLPALQTRLDEAFSPETNARYGLDAQGKAPKNLTFISRTVPVGADLTNYSDTGTKVDVWCNSLLGLTGLTSTVPVTENWYTLSVTLRWTGSDWKLIDYGRKAGPAPLPADQQAATSEEITGAVQQFGGFRYAR